MVWAKTLGPITTLSICLLDTTIGKMSIALGLMIRRIIMDAVVLLGPLVPKIWEVDDGEKKPEPNAGKEPEPGQANVEGELAYGFLQNGKNAGLVAEGTLKGREIWWIDWGWFLVGANPTALARTLALLGWNCRDFLRFSHLCVSTK